MCGRKVRVSCFSAPARSRSSILAVVAACAVLGSPFSKLHAQAITGVIVGTVQDATGGVVDAAKITAKNLATGIVLETASGSEGNYTFPNVPPGDYDISAQKAGFTTAVAARRTVEIQRTLRIDFTMSVGATTQEVTVAGAAPLVQSTTSDLGQVVNYRQIQALPLNGRLFEQLVTIVPGHGAGRLERLCRKPVGRRRAHADAGGRQRAAVVRQLLHGGWRPQHRTAERLHQHHSAARFDRLIQGGDQQSQRGIRLLRRRHRQPHHQVRHERLPRRGVRLLAQRRAECPRLLRPDPSRLTNRTSSAATFGGPIIRNKLFFFVAYQQLIAHQGQTNVLTVPTALQRQGMLTEGNQPPIYDPLTGRLFANNTIPSGRIDPVAQKVAEPVPACPICPGSPTTTSTTP